MERFFFFFMLSFQKTRTENSGMDAVPNTCVPRVMIFPSRFSQGRREYLLAMLSVPVVCRYMRGTFKKKKKSMVRIWNESFSPEL